MVSRLRRGLPAPLDGLFIQARDLREQPISPSTNALGLHCHIPATLLFIQSARASDSSADAVLDQDQLCYNTS
jgi:hypothetical protein